MTWTNHKLEELVQGNKNLFKSQRISYEIILYIKIISKWNGLKIN